MYKILEKQILNDVVRKIIIDAPLIARKAEPGQFVIIRANCDSERIPLTISDYDRSSGTITLIYQVVGASTMELDRLNKLDFINDVVGPLGLATDLSKTNKAVVVGGGVGSAIAFPIVKKLKELGKEADCIIGFRNKELIILEDEFKKVSDKFVIMTDDGSYGQMGLVTNALESLINAGNNYDEIFAIGPINMMKFVTEVAKKYKIKITVSMNPIMIDGTGMCGGCRLTVGGETKFACIDGPDFDGTLVDFDEVIRRNNAYSEFEKHARECNLLKLMNNE